MARVVTIRLEDAKYQLIKKCAENDNRPISNFIETATLRYIEDYINVENLSPKKAVPSPSKKAKKSGKKRKK